MTEADRFLAETLARQARRIAPYAWAGDQVWIKKAEPGHPRLLYTLMGLMARAAGLPLLRPVPNPGGSASIAAEAQRLRIFAAAGLQVPELLATQAGGLMTRHLGRAGQGVSSLGDEMDPRWRQGGADRLLTLWREGLDLIARVHAADTCLSQAFARNFVRDRHGQLACIDFEDDPAAAMPLAQAQARDWLCYLLSTTQYLKEAGCLAQGIQEWHARQIGLPQPVGDALADAVRRLAWMRHLPAPKGFARDLRRVQAAAHLLTQAAR